MTRPRTGGRRALAYFFFFLAFLFALAVLSGGDDSRASFFSGAVAAVVGWLILRSVRRDLAGSRDAARVQRQLAVLRLAEAEDGQLTVTEVATKPNDVAACPAQADSINRLAARLFDRRQRPPARFYNLPDVSGA